MRGSHAATWHGPRRNLTEAEALQEVLDYVWTCQNLSEPGYHDSQQLALVQSRLHSVVVVVAFN